MVFVSERFEAKVDIQGPWDCWEWKGSNSQGYGHIGIKGKFYKAHRLAFEWSRGRPIQPGMEVMHICDNPACVNPCHLEEGTHKENMADSARKGRNFIIMNDPVARERQKANTPRGDRNHMRRNPDAPMRGEQNGNSKLTWEQVREIRRLRVEQGLSQPQLARMFGVTHPLIGQIVRGQLWKEDPQGK